MRLVWRETGRLEKLGKLKMRFDMLLGFNYCCCVGDWFYLEVVNDINEHLNIRYI